MQTLSTSMQWSDSDQLDEIAADVFNLMSFTYGTRFADQWRGIDTQGVRRHWAAALAGISPLELARGIERLRLCDWPPTLPEFLKLCRPVLDPVSAYHEALEQGARRQRGEEEHWSHPAVYWAFARIGMHDLQHTPWTSIRPRWEAALRDEMAKAEHAPIPAPMVALPAPGKTGTSSDDARRRLAQLGVGQPKASRPGSTAWAKKIMERHKRGEQVFLASLEAAEKVLGIR